MRMYSTAVNSSRVHIYYISSAFRHYNEQESLHFHPHSYQTQHKALGPTVVHTYVYTNAYTTSISIIIIIIIHKLSQQDLFTNSRTMLWNIADN